MQSAKLLCEIVSGLREVAKGQIEAWLRGDDLPRERRGERPKWGEFALEEFSAEQWGLPAFGFRVVLLPEAENPFSLQVQELGELLENPALTPERVAGLQRQLGFARANLERSGTSPERRDSHARTDYEIVRTRTWLRASFHAPRPEPGEQEAAHAF